MNKFGGPELPETQEPWLDDVACARQWLGEAKADFAEHKHDCLEHHPGLYSENGKAKETDEWHFKVTVVLEWAKKR